jgi:hypothetical protein
MKWQDGTPKSTGNAFSGWKSSGGDYGRQPSMKQVTSNATRVNRETALGAFSKPAPSPWTRAAEWKKMCEELGDTPSRNQRIAESNAPTKVLAEFYDLSVDHILYIKRKARKNART